MKGRSADSLSQFHPSPKLCLGEGAQRADEGPPRSGGCRMSGVVPCHRTDAARILRPSTGNPGDVKPVGHGISEMRVDYGPGYRVYYIQRRQTLIVLLCGGDKTLQASDVCSAIAIAKEWKE